MTNRKMREMENRIRQALEEPYEPTDERIEEIKQRAFEEYQRYLNAHKQDNEKKEKRAQMKRSILRHVVVVAAVAVSFFIFSIIYSVLAPVTVANADNFVRRVAIWINNQLHLGITFYTPINDEKNVTFSIDKAISSIEELKKIVHFPIVYLTESDELILNRIDYSTHDATIEKIALFYQMPDNKAIVITIEPLYERNTTGINNPNTKEINTAIGTVYLWPINEHTSQAFIAMDGSTIRISSSCSTDELEELCYGLLAN